MSQRYTNTERRTLIRRAKELRAEGKKTKEILATMVTEGFKTPDGSQPINFWTVAGFLSHYAPRHRRRAPKTAKTAKTAKTIPQSADSYFILQVLTDPNLKNDKKISLLASYYEV